MATQLTPEQLKWIAEQPANSPAWEALSSPQYNPAMADLKAAQAELNNKYVSFGDGSYGLKPGSTETNFNDPNRQTGSLEEARALANKVAQLQQQANQIQQGYTQAIDAVKGPGYATEMVRTYGRNAYGSDQSFGKGFSNALQSAAIPVLSGAGGALGGIAGGPLGAAGASAATNKILSNVASQEAVKSQEPAWSMAGGLLGAGLTANALNPAPQQAPSGPEYGQPGYGQTPEYGQPGYTDAMANTNAAGLEYGQPGWTESMANSGTGLAGAGAGAGVLGDIGSTPPPVSPAASGLGTLGKVAGGLAGPALGYLGSKNIADKQGDLAQQFASYGAPYRGKLADLYANPESFLQSKEVTTPVQQGTDLMARSLSTTGNPFGSGNKLQQLQSYATDQLYGKLGQEKDRLAGFGGLSSYNQAAPQQASNAIGSQSNMWNAIGAGASNLNDIFNPPKQSGFDRFWESIIGK